MKFFKICIFLIAIFSQFGFAQVPQHHVEDDLNVVSLPDQLLSGDSTMVLIQFGCSCCDYYIEDDGTFTDCKPNGWHWFPNGTDLYTAYIISGKESGALISANERGDSCLGSIAVDQRSNNASFTLTTHGKENDNIDTIVVRVSMKLEPYLSKDITIYVFPVPKLHVSMQPDTIVAGDTASIVIKRQLVNGSLVDFPVGQLFEVGMTGGCGLGYIYDSDTAGSHIYNKSGPFKFVASANTGSGAVTLFAGVDDLVSTIEWFNTNFPLKVKGMSDFMAYKEKVQKRKIKNTKDDITICNSETGVCSIFTEQAVLDKQCERIWPAGIKKITDDNFEVTWLSDNCEPCSKKADRLGHTNYLEFMYHTASSRTLCYALDLLTFRIQQRFCPMNLKNLQSTSHARLIDIDNGQLKQLSIDEIYRLIQDLAKINNGKIIGDVLFVARDYVRKHEDYHVIQYKDLLREKFNEVIKEIKRVMGPANYCDNLAKYNIYDSECQKTITKIMHDAGEEINQFTRNEGNVNTWEKEAVIIGEDYLKNNLIPRCVNYYNNLKNTKR
jgi:hypothetical protein